MKLNSIYQAVVQPRLFGKANGCCHGQMLRPLIGIFTLALLLLTSLPGQAQTTVFDDEFNGPTINTTVWNIHDDSWNLQRTHFGKAPTIVTESGTTFARFGIDTYNPAHAGTNLLGTEMWSNQQFTMGPGTEFETRIRGTNIPRGIVYSFFTYKQRNFGTDPDQEEIDNEFLGNQAVNQFWLNIWNNGGSWSTNPTVAGVDRTAWNVFKIRWLNDRVEWWINSTLVRTETNVMPDDYMSLCFNIWAADSGWSTAYDSNLPASNSAASNATYYFDVDYMRVRTIAPTGTGVIGNGTGLSGVYFNNTTLTNPTLTKQAYRIDYNWNSGSPDPSIGPDNWSARWSGQIQAQYTEPYTFSANTDDGVRLYINNQLVINNWQAGSTTTTGTINLTAGQWYDFRMEYFDGTGNAQAQLYWSSPSTTKQLVPTTQLSPYAATPVLNVPAGTYYTPQTVTITDATPGADLHYTLDGTDPTRNSAQIASGGTLTFNNTTTLKVAAWRDGYFTSPINTAIYTIVNDPVPPTVSVTAPIATYSYTSLPQATGTAADSGSGVQSVTGRLFRFSDNTYWNGTAWTATPTELPGTGTTSWAVKLPTLPDGRYTFRATVRDAAGNSTQSSVADFYIDTVAPSITIATPTAASYNNLPQAAGTAVDTGPGVAQVTGRLFRYSDNTYWNGSAWTATPAEVVATGMNNWILPLPPLADGKYSFRASATDYVGNKASTTPFDFYIDTTPPTGAIATPVLNGAYRSLAQAAGTAGDAFSGVAQVRGRLYRYADGAFWNGFGWVPTDTDSPAQGTANWTFNLPALADGKYSFRAAAVDNAGNIGYSGANDFFIDNVPPSVTISLPTANALYAGSFTATGTAADAMPGVQQVNCQLLRNADNAYWNGSGWASTPTNLAASGTTNWSWSLPALSDGKYSLIASATDWVGNVSAPVVTNFTVDATPPTVAFSAPTNGSTVTGLPYIAGTAQDNLSGLNNLVLTIRRNSDGLFWSGSAWSSSTLYLPASLASLTNNSTWALRSNLPGAANLPSGSYTLTAYVADDTGAGGAPGNGRGTAAITINVQSALPTPTPTLPPDKTAPSVSFISPTQGAVVSKLVAVVGRADDTGGSGLKKVDLLIQRRSDRKYWSGSAWNTVATRLTTVVSYPSWSRRTGLPSGTNLVAGQYNLQAVATDNALNQRSALITITIGQPAPLAVKFVSPLTGTTLTGLPYVAGQASGGDGIARVTLAIQRHSDSRYWNGTAWGTAVTAIPTTLSLTSWVRRTGLPGGANLPAGQYSLQATAYTHSGSKLTSSIAVTIKPATTTSTGASVGTTAPASAVQLSTIAASSATQSVRLVFTAALDAVLAADATYYQVTVNGHAVTVESAAYIGTNHSVSLSLPDGSLVAGDRIAISWQGLKDVNGKLVAANTLEAVAH